MVFGCVFRAPDAFSCASCPFPNFDTAKRRVNVIFFRGEGESIENNGIIDRWLPDFARKSPCFHPQAFTLIVQSVNDLRRVGEEVKAKNEKLLRRRCARTHASERERSFTRRKGEGTPERGCGRRPRAKKSEATATAPTAHTWERWGRFGRSSRGAAVGE